MRVIAGELRGRRLRAPRGRGTRPTSDRVRESVFNLLGPLEPGARVLDLYAGSGALGIEALSRGAGHATFVEERREAVRTLRENLETLGLTERADVLVTDAASSELWGPGPWDVILADPPYAEPPDRLVDAAAGGLAPGGKLVLEHSARTPSPEGTETLALWKERRYGDTRVSIYRRIDGEPA